MSCRCESSTLPKASVTVFNKVVLLSNDSKIIKLRKLMQTQYYYLTYKTYPDSISFPENVQETMWVQCAAPLTV